MSYTALGELAFREWLSIPDHHSHVRLDAFVVMPDHVHGIIERKERAPASAEEGRGDGRPRGPGKGALGAIIGSYRAGVSRKIGHMSLGRTSLLWQRCYHDVIVRDARALSRIRACILRHPGAREAT